MKTYIKTVSEPWFSYIKEGLKKVEGRLNKGNFAEMEIGDLIIFKNNGNQCKIKITKINHFTSFKEYLMKKKLSRCLPGINSIDEGVSVYHKFYSIADVKKYGILAINIKLIE